ncbi:MAG TPA: ATP-binding protein [Pyrinomonadaceae bacterium]|nr:ATP-binding protein [Pyrinomonadaceae bacterium]
MSPEERQLLKEIFRRLKDEPLKPDTERYRQLYQPLYEHPGCEDPVQLLETYVEFSDVESIQLFSGFRGSGKTTELLRLKKQLEQQGYVVLYADAVEYVNPSEEIDISDLLIVLAGAFSDALEEWAEQLQESVKLANESYWTRLKTYLTRTIVNLEEAGVKLEANTPAKEVLGGVKAGIDLKLALKESPSFRRNLQQFLQNRIGELRAEVVAFFQDGVKAVKQVWGDEKQVVFIFDSLEQLRGSLTNEREVLRSVERVFASHLNLLELPYVHVIYTVPPWLEFVMPGVDINTLWTIKLWNNDPPRSHYEYGWNALRSLVLKRLGKEACQKVFNCQTIEPFTAADDLIDACGGDLRIMLRLLRETLLRARSLPISQEAISGAITSVRGDFMSISIEDARWLAQIGEQRKHGLPDTNPESVNRLTRFLDTHFVLYLKNGEKWYDTHPLIREEVTKIIERHSRTGSQSQSQPINPATP